MRITIDRISQETVICEDENGDRVKLTALELPAGAAEGDILSKEGGIWVIDREETEKRRTRMRERLGRLIE